MTATTPDAATTVRRLLEAFLSGDMETLMSCADDEIEWNPAQHNPVITRQYRAESNG
jgi:ketosteroid isomerase-like protein